MEQKKLSVFSPPERVRLRKCAVIGCGNVGATVAYTLM